MLFQTYGDRRNPAVLFFHAMGVTGASSEPVANYLQDRYFCILPTSTVYCEGQKYVSKLDEIRQVEGLSASTGRGAAGDGGRFFHRCRPCHGIFDTTRSCPLGTFSLMAGNLRKSEKVCAAL